MRVRHAPFAAFVVVAVVGVAASASAVARVLPSDQDAGRTMPAAAPAQPAAADLSASDQVIVQYKAGVTAAEARSHAKGLGATVKKQIVGPAVPHGRLAVVRAGGLGVQRLIARYEADPQVEYAEPDAMRDTSATPNDTRFTELWGLQQIYAPRAWDVSKGAAGVVVADIDSGVYYMHPDLNANAYRNSAEWNGVQYKDDDGNGYVDDYYGWDAIDGDGYPTDGYGHGTHTAGTIAAVGNNSRGVTGVCWTAKIMACRFIYDASGGYTSDAIECINYVVAQKQHGVNVVAINASYGGTTFSTAEYNAITAAGNAGIVFVAAAGNDSANNDSSPHYPANYNCSNIISVAAVDSHNRLAFFSDYGYNSVELAAPGCDVLSTVPTSYDASGYAYMSGTSMAAPHVTGAIALCAAVYPGDTMATRRSRVLTTTDSFGSLSGKVRTGGVLDVARAVGLSAPGFADIPGVPALSSYKYGSLNQTSPDVVYRVFLKAGAQVTARLSGDADYQLYLFGPGATTVADKGVALASATAGAYPRELTYTVPATGVFYVNVTWISGTGNFRLAFNAEKDEIPGVPFTPGNLIPWLDFSEQMDNVYSVPLAYGQTLTTSIVSPPAGADFYLYLQPPGTFTVWSRSAVSVASVTSGAYPRTMTYHNWKSGTYYVDAFAKAGGGWYTLTHSVTGSGDNDVPGTSIPGSGYSSFVSYSLDRDDVFALPLFPRQTVTVNLSDSTAGTDMDLYLFGPDATTVEGHGGAVASSASASNPESLTFTTPPDAGGPIHFASTYYVDLNAVAGDGVYTLTYSTLYDTIAPTTGATGLQSTPASGWRAMSQDVTLTPADTGGSGLSETGYTVDGAPYTYSGPFTVSGSGSHVVTYWSTDHAANSESVHTGYVNIDTTPPETAAGGLTDAGTWRNTEQTVTLEPYDDQSRVAETYYVLEGEKHLYERSPFMVSEPGSHEVSYWSIDRVGNEEKPRVGYVNIDRTPPAAPEASLSPLPSAGWSNGDVVVTIHARDEGGSGVQKTQYAVHHSGVWKDTNVENGFTVPGPADHRYDGVHVYDCRAVDNAGNPGNVETVTVRIDTTAPQTRAQASDLLALDEATWHAGPLTVALTPSDPTAADGTCSGMSGGRAATQYSTDGGTTWRTATSAVFPRWKRGGGSGGWRILFASTDAAGNAATPEIVTLLLDNRAPDSSDDAPSGVQAGPVTVHVRAVDGDSGPALVWYSLDGGVWAQAAYPGLPGVPVVISGAGSHTLRYYAVDGAGNAQVGYRVCQVTIAGGTAPGSVGAAAVAGRGGAAGFRPVDSRAHHPLRVDCRPRARCLQ